MTSLLRNLKIGQRSALGSGLVLALLLGIAALSLGRMAEFRANLEHLAALQAGPAAAVRDMDAAASRGAALARDLILSPAAAREQVSRDLQGVREAYDEAERRLGQSLQTPTPEEQGLLDTLTKRKAAALSAVEAVARLVRTERVQDARALLMQEGAPAHKAWVDAIHQMADQQVQQANRVAETARERGDTMRVVVLTAALFATLVGVIGAWAVTISITRPIAQAVGLAQTLASGDLSVTPPPGGRDEPGELLLALGQMADGLSKLVSRVRSNSDAIASGSGQIANGNEDLSQRTEQQASSLQQTAASMEQINGTVRNTADTARQASELATAASRAAEDGGRVVDEVVSTMNGISSSSRRIGDIIGVIDGIAFQTNILALNAAVEAARAGEQGRGFAVVAGEVRNLAQRSAEAAREIKLLIGDSVSKVEGGTRLVADAGRTMGGIVAQVKRVSDMISEISLAAQEQTQGIAQVGQAVTQLDQVTQQNAALVEQLAAAAGSLKSRAGELVGSVQQFKLAGKVAEGTSEEGSPVALAAGGIAGKSIAGGDGDWTQF